MKTVLLTSCNSYLGYSFAKKFLSEGFKVIGTYRNMNPRVKLLQDRFPKSFEAFTVDLGIYEDFLNLPTQIDYILHNSATFPWIDVTNEEAIVCNVDGTLNLAKWIEYKKISIKVFILISTLSIFGQVDEQILDEDCQKKSENIYGVTKHLSELIVREEVSAVKKFTIRLPVVLGYSAHRAWIPEAVRKLKKNETVHIFNSDNKYNSLTTDFQLTNFTSNLFSHSENYNSMDVNIGSSQAIKIIEIVQLLRSELNSKSELIETESDSGTYLINNKKAESIGYSPPPVIDALHYYVNSLKNNNI